MKFDVVCATDVGTAKKCNQDALMAKSGQYDGKAFVMAVLCDGMGGLQEGEIASATVIQRFNRWFCEEFAKEADSLNMRVIAEKWVLMLKELNVQIGEYGQKNNMRLGTTFTGVLIVDDQLLCVHVGDTRLYQIGKSALQLTRDQTFVAREIERGNMTLQQAKTDKRRNLLLQCVGASDQIEPQVILKPTQQGMYMLCCDGFRHEISDKEIYDALNYNRNPGKKQMQKNVQALIELNKKRKEKDNISSILIRVEEMSENG